MKNKFLIYFLLIFLALAAVLSISCSKKAGDDLNPAAAIAVEKKELILASTTSTDDSGLFEILLPDFEKSTGYKVKLIAVGSGEAMKLGERGEADLSLIHI